MKKDKNNKKGLQCITFLPVLLHKCSHLHHVNHCLFSGETGKPGMPGKPSKEGEKRNRPMDHFEGVDFTFT